MRTYSTLLRIALVQLLKEKDTKWYGCDSHMKTKVILGN